LENHKHQKPNILTKERLLEAALIEFSQHGYFRTNVDSITKTARVSHGTFYLYFKNKSDVLINLMQGMMSEMSAWMENKRAHKRWLDADNLHDFEQPISYIIKILATPSGLLKAFVQGMLQNNEVLDLFTRIFQRFVSIFKIKIESLQKKGLYQGCDADIISQIMTVTLFMSIIIRSMDIINCSPRILAKNISYIFFAGLSFDEKMIKSPDKKRQTPRKNKGVSNKTKEDLLDAAKQEFVSCGYFDTKVANIAERAGYSRGTFYQHFKDKDDIIKAIHQGMLIKLNPSNNISDGFISDLDTTCVNDLVEINSTIIDVFESYGPLNWTFLQGAYYSKQLNEHYKGWFSHFSTPMIKKIDKLKTEGKCQGIDSLIASQIILTTVSYSVFMNNMGIIQCSKHAFAVNMAEFLYYFLNFMPAKNRSRASYTSKIV